MVRSRDEYAFRDSLADAVWRDPRKDKDAFSADREARQIMSSMHKQLGVELPNLPLDPSGRPVYGMIAGKVRDKPGSPKRESTYDDYLRNLVLTKKFADTQDAERALAAAYGVEQMTPELKQKAYDAARGRQAFAGSIKNVGMNSTVETMRNLGEMLEDGDVPDVVLRAMNTSVEKLRAAQGNAAADGFKVQLDTLLGAGKVKEAIAMAGITDQQLKSVIPSNAVFDVPLLKDMPPWGQAAALGGAGAAAGGLAYHLMAQGQQQQSSADYAAAMQALNAY